MKRRSVLLATAVLTASVMTSVAWGQAGYPDRPIRVILPYAAGVSPDIVARLVAERLSPALGKPVIIDNRPGAGGMIGAEAAATMPPDGYNLLFTVKGVMAIVPHVYPSAKFNTLKDFKAVVEILQVPHIIVATSKAPYNNMKELVEYARKNPGKINYASNGTCSHPHVGMETVANKPIIELVHVTYTHVPGSGAHRRGGVDTVSNKPDIALVHVPYNPLPAPDVTPGVVVLFLEASTTA